MLEKENQLWQAFEKMAEKMYYGYIPHVIEHDGSFLAEHLKNLINELADWRKNTVLAITNCPYFDRVGEIEVGRYDGVVTVWMKEGWIDASLTVSKEHIALWANINGKTIVHRVARFADGGLRRFCEEAGIEPRLEIIIWKNMQRLVAKVDCISRWLDKQKDANPIEKLSTGVSHE